MDPANLIAVTTLECSGWLNSTSSETFAWATQERLVGVARSSLRRHLPAQRAREALFDAINAASQAVVTQVPAAIAEVQQSGATYLMEFEARDETIREVYAFEQLPFIGSAQQAFGWMARLRDLPQSQQALVLRVLELELDIRNVSVHMQFAHEDGDTREQTQLSTEMGALKLRAAQLFTQLHPDALTAKEEVQQVMSPSAVQRCPPVIETTAKQRSTELLSAAASMDRAGDSLTQALPITKETKASVRKKAEAAWARLGDLGNTLHVLAIWLRALAADGGSRRCVLCYRHIGYRGKNFCAEHQRRDGKRQPARDFHIAERYPEVVERLSKTEPELRSAVNSAGQVDHGALADAVNSLPEGIRIPEPLIQPASVLMAALRRAAPATGPELEGQVDRAWQDLVRIASEPYAVSGHGSKEDVVGRRVRQEQARRWLTWNTFFKAWWAKTHEGPGQTPSILAGQGFDIDHPAANGIVVPPGALVMDLLRQRAWTIAERRIDSEEYVSVAEIGRLTANGLSLRAVAQALGVSHETVRKTLLYGAGRGPVKERRLRALPSPRVPVRRSQVGGRRKTQSSGDGEKA